MKPPFIFEDDNEFATFELRRLSYDVGTGIEIKSSDEDADDLLLLSLTDDLSPDVFAGLAWAVNNRPVNWALHFAESRATALYGERLRLLLEKAGLSTTIREQDYPEARSPKDLSLDEEISSETWQ
jgi:hypothetical protein